MLSLPHAPHPDRELSQPGFGPTEEAFVADDERDARCCKAKPAPRAGKSLNIASWNRFRLLPDAYQATCPFLQTISSAFSLCLDGYRVGLATNPFPAAASSGVETAICAASLPIIRRVVIDLVSETLGELPSLRQTVLQQLRKIFWIGNKLILSIVAAGRPYNCALRELIFPFDDGGARRHVGALSRTCI